MIEEVRQEQGQDDEFWIKMITFYNVKSDIDEMLHVLQGDE